MRTSIPTGISSIFLTLIGFSWANTTPAIVWSTQRHGETADVGPKLTVLNPQQFANVLLSKSEAPDSLILVFIVESLSLEDFSGAGDESTERYPRLNNILDMSAESIVYPDIESVDSMLTTLSKKGFQLHKLSAAASPKIPKGSKNVIVVNFVGDSSSNIDEEIYRVYLSYVKNFHNVVGILSTQKTSWMPDDFGTESLNRLKRETEAETETMRGIYPLTDGLIYLDKVNITIRQYEGKESGTADYDSVEVDSVGNGTHSLNIVYKFKPKITPKLTVTDASVTMTLKNGNDGYWSLSNLSASFNGKLNGNPVNLEADRMSSGVTLLAPAGMSFHCSRFGSMNSYSHIKSSNYTISIEFFRFQIEAFSPMNKTKFGPSYECVGFFTPGIWSGIFISIILMSVMTWGLAMIMNVKTMDRFDDPKGKPISIGGTE